MLSGTYYAQNYSGIIGRFLAIILGIYYNLVFVEYNETSK